MIQFDNGPANGDFVRYIDRLHAERPPMPSMEVDAFRPAPQRLSPPMASPGEVVTRAGDGMPPVPPAGRLSPSQAIAAAAALMAGDRQRARDGRDFPRFAVETFTVDPRAWLEIAAVVIGGAVAVVGLFVQTFGPLLLFAGIGIAVTMVQRILRRRGFVPTPKSVRGRTR